MNPGAKPAVERVLDCMKRARRGNVRRPLRGDAQTRSRHHPDRTDVATRWPADDPATPAARLLIDGTAFEIDGAFHTVEAVHPSTTGTQADVLVMRGFEHTRDGERTTLRAIQVRDLEAMIDDGLVEIPFAGCAKRFNLQRGWRRGGRTLRSPGDGLGSRA